LLPLVAALHTAGVLIFSDCFGLANMPRPQLETTNASKAHNKHFNDIAMKLSERHESFN
jgi:hypothetical protein